MTRNLADIRDSEADGLQPNLCEVDLADKIELYKIYVSTAERNIDRRGETNRFFQTMFSAALALIVFLLSGQTAWTTNLSVNRLVLIFLISALAFFVGFFWSSQLKSHSALSTAKYMVIHALELGLPVRPFSDEEKVNASLGKSFNMVARELLVPRFLLIIGVMGVILSAVIFAWPNAEVLIETLRS